MASFEPNREPTIGDVLHAVQLLSNEVQMLRREFTVLRGEYESLRRIVIDEFAAMRHHVQALDRDVQGIAQRLMEQGDES